MPLIQPTVGMDYKMEGPLAGYYAAQQMEDYMGAQDRSFRDSDIMAALKQNELQNALADNPLKAAERQNKLSEAQDTGGAWASGENAALAAQARQTKLAELVGKKSEAELNVLRDKSEVAINTAAQLGDPARMDPTVAARWADITEPMRKAGMNVPTTYSPEAHRQVLAAGKAAIETSKFIQARMLQNEKLASEEKIAARHDTAHIQAANAGAGMAHEDRVAARENARMMARMNNPSGAIVADLQEKITKGQVLNGSDLNAALAVTKSDKDTSSPQSKELLAARTTDYQARPDHLKQDIEALGMPKDSQPADVAQRRMQVEEAVHDTNNIKIRFSNGSFDKDGKPVSMAQLTYKDIPLFSELPVPKKALSVPSTSVPKTDKPKTSPRGFSVSVE